jgi:DNA-binding NtrC family response regulator
MRSLLIISTDPQVFSTIRSCFSTEHRVDGVSGRDEGLDVLRKKRYDFVFIDLDHLRGSDFADSYKASLQPFWQLYPAIEVVVMTTQEKTREAVMAVKAGASNYLTYPVNPDEVKYVTESVYEFKLLQSELEYLRDQFWQADSIEIIHTKSPLMREVFDKIRSVAPAKSTVLLLGETGTGKGVLAKLIHRHSSRRDGGFISLHCGAIPDTLLESELFGHEKGAFTGAVRRKLGKFEIAKGGTVFLDEIATITPSAQVKLLQIIQDGIFQRVGGEETIKADVRIIAASNVDIKEMSEEGRFRKDLFYRLNVFPIEVPPLRERKDDIPILIEIFLRDLHRSHSKQILDVHTDVLRAFEQYPWPGNIRELENLIERAFILEPSSVLTPESFPSDFFSDEASQAPVAVDISLTLAQVRRSNIESLEKCYLMELLAEKRGRIETTARAAGISTRHLHDLMKKYRLRKEDFKSPAATEG